ncbi:MAG: hypothetical protein EWM47_11415, partial [Anaerolineaceae bacterium]
MTYSRQSTTKKLILTGMFTAIIAVMSQIIIPIQPIPFSLSLLAIFLTGMMLEPKYAFFSTLAYILLGAFGLPVFAGLKGGIYVLTGMTGGFIMAYPIMAFITSVFSGLSVRLKSTSFNKKEFRLRNSRAERGQLCWQNTKCASAHPCRAFFYIIGRTFLLYKKIAQLAIATLGMIISLFI